MTLAENNFKTNYQNIFEQYWIRFDNFLCHLYDSSIGLLTPYQTLYEVIKFFLYLLIYAK